jgi:hypothetical protein
MQQTPLTGGKMSVTQLNPPIPMHVIGKGDGFALALIDYSQEHHLVWVVAINETGELWSAPNPIVRMQSNWSLQREKPTMKKNAADADSVAARTRGHYLALTDAIHAMEAEDYTDGTKLRAEVLTLEMAKRGLVIREV